MVDVMVKESPVLSKQYEKRYIVVDKDTGEVLDDAQGYGYKTRDKAYAAWNYKHRDKSKDKEKQAKRRKIQKWLREHKSFAEDMCEFAFEIEKGSWGADTKFNAKFVRKMLKDNELEVDFTAGELLKVWKSMNVDIF